MYKLQYKIWLEKEDKAFGRGPYELLLGIKKTGSIAQAARNMHMSYSQAHTLLKKISCELGFPLLVSYHGGAKGGETSLTPQAEQLMNSYEAFMTDCDVYINQAFKRHFCFKTPISLAGAFGLTPGSVVAFVGGGGKTSLMFRLAAELAVADEKVLVCTTTRIKVPVLAKDQFLVLNEDAFTLKNEVENQLAKGRVIVASPGIAQNKLLSVETDWLEKIENADYVLNEADGAKGRPFKAPAEHEPVISKNTSCYVVVVGLDVLGKTLDAASCWRPELASSISGRPLGSIIDEDLVVDVLMHPAGGQKNLPAKANWVVCLNKAEGKKGLVQAEKLAKKLLKRGAKIVVATAAKEEDPVVKIWRS